MDSRLGQNHQYTDHKAQYHQQCRVHGRQLGAQLIADGHKAHVDTGEEQDKTCVCKQNTHTDLQQLPLGQFQEEDLAQVFCIDFSVVDDVHYYNGVVFKGFVSGVPSSVLSGGQYDRLMKKMGRKSGAIGFAVYTDVLDRLWDSPNPYDVETVLLYPENAPLQAVTQKVRQLTAQGLHVLALPRLPEDLRYQQLLTLEVNDLADHT